jgi:hypothetical protein
MPDTSNHLVIAADDPESGKVRIVRDDSDRESFTIHAFDGSVGFRADPGSTAAELLSEGLNAYDEDEFEERGQGLDSMQEADRDSLIKGYLQAGLSTAGLKDHDVTCLSSEAKSTVYEDLDGFMRSFGGLVRRAIAEPGYGSYDQVGEDFSLTRNRHGAGFWDRGLGELGTDLSEMSRPFGSVIFELADDGKIHSKDG